MSDIYGVLYIIKYNKICITDTHKKISQYIQQMYEWEFKIIESTQNNEKKTEIL